MGVSTPSAAVVPSGRGTAAVPTLRLAVSGAFGSTVNDQLAPWPLSVSVATSYEPGASGAAGTTTTALSPPRIELATPEVLDLVSTHVGIGPLGPSRVATAPLCGDGRSAISGRPTLWPLQPQKVRGSGDSATKRVRLVVAPSPGKKTGAVGFAAAPSMPRTTSRVAAERHLVLVGLGGLAHIPKPV